MEPIQERTRGKALAHADTRYGSEAEIDKFVGISIASEASRPNKVLAKDPVARLEVGELPEEDYTFSDKEKPLHTLSDYKMAVNIATYERESFSP
ncbi:hypothetical protein JTB14_020943 [Gonioctena quinquepunctata]|nr:hypothetical protein JTB14_020943 [Gonioctena quinquepunctata]